MHLSKRLQTWDMGKKTEERGIWGGSSGIFQVHQSCVYMTQSELWTNYNCIVTYKVNGCLTPALNVTKSSIPLPEVHHQIYYISFLLLEVKVRQQIYHFSLIRQRFTIYTFLHSSQHFLYFSMGTQCSGNGTVEQTLLLSS